MFNRLLKNLIVNKIETQNKFNLFRKRVIKMLCRF